MYQWARRGGYEVSSHGDKRFSAFNAYLPNGVSIEAHYQTVTKGYGGNDWRVGKGKPPLGDWPGDSLYMAYKALWEKWAKVNPTLMTELRHHADRHGGVISDRFASSPVNQARALSDLLNEGY